MDRILYYRKVYNLLEWLADIGGLGRALQVIFSNIVFALNVNATKNFLVSQLMKEKASSETEDFTEGIPLDASKLSCCSEFFYGFLNLNLKCLKKSK